MSGSQQLQQLAQEIEVLNEQQEALEEEIAALQSEQMEIDEAIDALGELDSGNTVQVPLGGGAYLRAEIQDIDEVIVDLGADYAAEREQDAAIDSLETKKETIDDRIEEIREEVAEIESEAEELEQRAQQMQQQQMQQQMQQMQQQGGEDDE